MAINKRVLLPGILLLIALVLTYWNHFNNPFHFDDEHTIVTNMAIRDIGNVPKFFTDATTTSSLPANQAYRPGLTTLNAIDFWIGGKDYPDPFFFHLSIFISYVLLGFLLFFLFLDVFNKARPHHWNPWFAWFATGWYWLHTANAETINYIISRSDSFSTLMIIAAFAAYIFMPRGRKYFIFLIPMIIGFFVKEPAIMFGPLLFLYITLFEQKVTPWGFVIACFTFLCALVLAGGLFTGLYFVANIPVYKSFGITGSVLLLLLFGIAYYFLFIKKKIFSGIFKKENVSAYYDTAFTVLPAFIIGIILFMFYRSMTPPTWTSGASDWKAYLITQPFAILHYFNNFLLPMNLSADTDWTLIRRIWDDRVLVGSAFILMMLGIAFYSIRRIELRPVTFGILWFFIALLPTSSVFPFAEVLNDHRPFFPYIGLVMAGTWAIAILIIRYERSLGEGMKLGLLVIAGLFLMAHAAGTRHRNEVWSTGESLWRDVTVKSPGNARGWMNYGNAMMQKGQYDEALKCYLKAKEIWPYYSYVYINLGVLKGEMGLPKEAEENYRLALTYGPNNPEAYYYFARWLKNNGRTGEASELLQKGLQVSPGHVNMQALMGELQATGTMISGSKLDNAIAQASNNPTPESYLNLSLELYLAGKYNKSIDAAKEALKLRPGYAEAYNNICSAYTMLGEYEKAEKACLQALELKPDYELAKNNLKHAQQLAGEMTKLVNEVKSNPTAEGYLNLSLVYYNKQQYERSIEAARQALKLKPDYDLAYNNICSAYNMLGQWDKAIEAGKKALEINPQNTLAKNNLLEAVKQKDLLEKK